MSVLEFSLIVGAGSLVAGFLGALTGLGGGVVIVPMLSLLLGVDIRYAIGASLVSVIATSSGAAAAYVREGISNIRIGMFLEVATTLGAIAGATLATHISTGAVSIVFGVVLIGSASLSWKRPAKNASDDSPDALATRLRLNGSFPEGSDIRKYNVRRVPLGWGLMFGAGTLSGLLGIGSGAMKVLAMDQAMKIPFKVSTTTSNFMIGVTAAASAGIYLSRGYIDPGLSMPVMLGVLAGSLLGTRVLVKTHPKWLRRIFSVVIVALGSEMLYKGISGRI
ncbi:MAG: sulfite exporter TauE/SafE family protein [Candidatus Sulfotelmatobacter sp.]